MGRIITVAVWQHMAPETFLHGIHPPEEILAEPKPNLRDTDIKGAS
jgi:hypothetical protein